MHELSVTERILEIALRHAAERGASQITNLYLVIGQLSSYVDDSVQFYWDFVAQDTIAAQAKLHFRRIPAEMQCQACQTTFAPGAEEFACPQCGSSQVKITKGEEFFLEAMDIERLNETGIGSGP